MKIPLQYVDELGQNISQHGYDSFKHLKHKIATEWGVSVNKVTIENHIAVGEWVIYVDGKFAGYVED